MVSPMYPVPRDAENPGATDIKWFAGLAMQAIIVHRGVPDTQAVREEIALWSFRMAQAMSTAERQLHASVSD